MCMATVCSGRETITAVDSGAGVQTRRVCFVEIAFRWCFYADALISWSVEVLPFFVIHLIIKQMLKNISRQCTLLPAGRPIQKSNPIIGDNSDSLQA